MFLVTKLNPRFITWFCLNDTSSWVCDSIRHLRHHHDSDTWVCKSDHTWLWWPQKKHHHHYKKRKKPHYKEPPKYSHHTVTRPLEVTPKPPTGYPPTFKFKKRRLPLHQLATKTVVKLGHSKKKPYQVKWAKDLPFPIFLKLVFVCIAYLFHIRYIP